MRSWWILLILLCLPCCQRQVPRSILPADAEMRPGDIVFRRGGSMASNAVLLADRSGHYSHVGIVVDSCGVMMVVHAVPGEPEYEGAPDRVKMERPERFFSSLNACEGELQIVLTDDERLCSSTTTTTATTLPSSTAPSW